jgi:hypothetical protein
MRELGLMGIIFFVHYMMIHAIFAKAQEVFGYGF